MKIVKKSTEKCHFYSHEKSLYVAWACFCNAKDRFLSRRGSILNERYHKRAYAYHKNMVSLHICADRAVGLVPFSPLRSKTLVSSFSAKTFYLPIDS